MKIKIEKLVSGGDGLGFSEGKAVFVPFTLPGEEVKVKIIEEKKGFSRGELIEILEPSKNRQTPPCEYYGICGGCDFQHINYAEQLVQKEKIIQDTFSRIGKITVSKIDIIRSEPFSYRNRIQIHVADNKSGFKRKKSGEVISIKECPVCVKEVNQCFTELETVENGRYMVFGHQGWREIDLKEDPKELKVEINGKEVFFNIKTFFQSNLTALERVVPLLEAEARGDTLLDLYCGVGLFGTVLSSNFNRIIGIEENSYAADMAKKNLKNYGFKMINKPMEKIKIGPLGRIDIIIVDPPRVGLSKKARERIKRMEAEKLIYVSCDPVTQARDTAEFISAGWKIKNINLVDFYPQTSGIETVLILEKGVS
jgi:23S rRNA (uracil1939-C5)-methyltransferase